MSPVSLQDIEVTKFDEVYGWIFQKLFCLVSIKLSLRKKCPYSEFFWSVFSRIRTEYRDLHNKSPYLVRMRENTDQKISEYGYLLRSVCI